MDRILYLCFGNPFTEEMSYKENYLIKASVAKGREVLIIAPTQKFEGNQIVTTQECDVQMENGVRLIRLNYDKIICSFVSNKIRKVKKFIDIVLEFRPNVIFFNTIQVYNILDMETIKNSIPEVKIYADVSTSYCNSAQNFVSKYILHKGLYKNWICRALQYFDKIFYVAEASRIFLMEMYGVGEEKLELSPLCCQVFSRQERDEKKRCFYSSNGLSKGMIVFSHSGKMNNMKKTIELLEAFKITKEKNWRLFIAGAFDDSIAEKAKKLIEEDDRIKYLGFLNADELTDMLCATDLYLQPLSPSQTAQTAMGCLTPVLLAKIIEYEGYEESGCIYINDVHELGIVFEKITQKIITLNVMSQKTETFAHKYLDYIQTEERLFM